MRDVRIVVFDHLTPENYTEFLEQIKSSNLSLNKNEEANFAVTNADLGERFIGKWWPVPPGLVETVRSHHNSLGGEMET